MTTLARARRRTEITDAGDTLIELLLTVAIVGIGVVGLLGGLVTAITSTTAHRGLSVDDAILKSFIEAAKSEIQTGPTPQYANCMTNQAAAPATEYHLLGALNPTSGPAGTAFVLFGTGFTPNSALVARVGAVPATFVRGSSTDQNGDISASIIVPPGLLGGQSISIIDAGGVSATSDTQFLVTSVATGATPAEAGYSLRVTSMQYWNATANAFGPSGGVSSPCPATDGNLQLITVTATAANGVTNAASFVVRKPN